MFWNTKVFSSNLAADKPTLYTLWDNPLFQASNLTTSSSKVSFAFLLHSIPFLQLLKHPLADAYAITRTRVAGNSSAGILGDTGSIDTLHM